MSAQVVVGIAGGSGSGKTTLAERVMRRLPAGSAIQISHDAYYRDLSQLSLEARAAWNFDHPDSLESSLLCQHLGQLRAGDAVMCPQYDFGTHTRVQGGRLIRPAPVVVLDGVLVLAVHEVRAQLDLRVFVETNTDERLKRRVKRDRNERGRSHDSVLRQWEDTVWPMHMEFVEPSKAHADVVIHRGGFDPGGVETVVARIQQLLAGGRP